PYSKQGVQPTGDSLQPIMEERRRRLPRFPSERMATPRVRSSDRHSAFSNEGQTKDEEAPPFAKYKSAKDGPPDALSITVLAVPNECASRPTRQLQSFLKMGFQRNRPRRPQSQLESRHGKL